MSQVQIKQESVSVPKATAGPAKRAKTTKAKTTKARSKQPIYNATIKVYNDGRELTSLIQCSKSSPEAAASHVARKFIKELPLHEAIPVLVQSSVKDYRFAIVRDYFNSNRRSFRLTRLACPIIKKPFESV
jgi:hypothetical protein